MRVSFTDQWPTFLDENGKPLIGRIKFMKADASQFKNVFYEDDLGQEVYAPNPCYTLQDGRLEHQIFLDYGVYTCIVEKFIGSDWQNMRDYADLAEYWAEYKRFKTYGGEDVEGETSDLGSGFCGTIAALRTINPTEHSVVDVVGYYSKDDKIAPRTYVWVEGNGDAEDFGSTIMSSLSDFAAFGRWKLCETPVLCSTTFGVFPDRSNTITASELSQKASALAQFANASKCSEVFFPAGHYYLATGTTISFKPKVTSNGKDTNALQFDADGTQRDEEVVGTISVSFLGGLEVAQDKQLCENGSHAAFTFGAGTIKTSWLRYGTATHIHNSSAFRNIHCLLNHSASTTFCNEGDNFYNWTFEGTAQNNQYVSNGATFVDCRFIGKCFQCGNGLTFTRCGEIRTSQFNNQIKDNSVWNSSDGGVKSEGTMFLLDGAMDMVQNYGEHSLDNRFVKVVSENGILFNRNGGLKTLKHFDDGLRFRGEIIFTENMVGRDLIVSMYYSLSDCYASMKAVYDNYGVTCLIDMCGNTYSEYEVTEQSVLPFKNGSITFVCDGIMNLNIPTIHAEKAILTFSNVPSGTSFVLNAKDCEINLSDSGSYYLTLEDADCEGCTINGPMTLQNVANSYLKHRFVGCTFKSIINLDATANLTDVHCDIVITGCTFDSAYDPVMVVSNSSNFISDKYNKFIIKDNQFFGGAAMKPAHEFEGVFKSTIDGTTQAGCYTGSIVAGELRTDLYSEAFMFHVGHHSLIFEYIPYLEKTSGGGLILPQNIGVMTSELLNNVGIFLDVSNAGELQPIRILVKGKKV